MGWRTCMALTTSTKKQIIAHLMITGNWRRQKIAFSFISVTGGLKLFNSLYVRWWLLNVKSFCSQQWSEIECCAKSNEVWSFLDLHRYCLLFYFVNSWTKTVTYLPWNSSWSEKYNEGRRTNWLSYWLVDELQDCHSKFIRRLVEALRLVIHTARKILNRLYAKCLYNKEFIVLEKCGVMSIGQTHLSKGNFPINLDNILSIVQFPFWNKHDHSEQSSSKFPDFVLGRHNNYNLQSHILSRRVFWVFSLLLVSFFAPSSKQK